MNISVYEQFGISLVKTGDKWKACCPIHKEIAPSFFVYKDFSYHCFGCGAHGSYEDFVMFFSGDSSRIFVVRSLYDSLLSKEEIELEKMVSQIGKKINISVQHLNFESKNKIWDSFDNIKLELKFMDMNALPFMEKILFLKKESNKLLKKM